MPGLPLPGSVVVVRHDRHEVQVVSDLVQLVSHVDDLLVAGNGCCEDQRRGLLVEFCSKLLDEFREVGAVPSGSFVAVRLPADWVVPVEVEASEAVAAEEGDGCEDETAAGGAVGD